MGFTILIIAVLEGFSTLAIQMIALRAAVPVVGSSIVVTSIYIGIILMALSGGYYLGGVVASKYNKKMLPLILGFFLLCSAIYYGAITFGVHQQLLTFLLDQTSAYITTLFITAIILFFIPVFIAAQTIPLLTEISTIHSKGLAAGSMLFRSTIGSFLGSVGTTVVLFQQFGVIWTSVITVIILLIASLLSFLLYSRKYSFYLIAGFIILSGIIVYIGKISHPKGVVVHDSAYQQIIIEDIIVQGEPAKLFLANGAFASGIFTKTKESPFEYIREAVTVTEQVRPQSVLVIGTAGFTYPNEIAQRGFAQQIDAVDIDPAVYDIAVEHFLEQPLPDNITFYPQSARYFINNAIKTGKTYDLIFVDAFNGKQLPDELITQEFFTGLQRLAPSGTIIFNLILDRELSSPLATNIITTLNSVFPTIYSKNVGTNQDYPINNFIVVTSKPDQTYTETTRNGSIYTDNKRTSEGDMITFLKNEAAIR